MVNFYYEFPRILTITSPLNYPFLPRHSWLPCRNPRTFKASASSETLHGIRALGVPLLFSSCTCHLHRGPEPYGGWWGDGMAGHFFNFPGLLRMNEWMNVESCIYMCIYIYSTHIYMYIYIYIYWNNLENPRSILAGPLVSYSRPKKNDGRLE